MMAWLSRKLAWLRNRKKKEEENEKLRSLSKWHQACFWLAKSVGGVDMLLQYDGTVLVVLKKPDFDTAVISKNLNRPIQCFLRVNMLDEHKIDGHSKRFVFKTIDKWSLALAEFVVRVVSLSEVDPHNDPAKFWGIETVVPAGSSRLQMRDEVRFPTFKTEEELFMWMALDGVEVFENSGEEGKDAKDAQG